MGKGAGSKDDKPAVGRRLAALVAIAGLVGALLAVGFAVIRGDAWRVPLVLVAVRPRWWAFGMRCRDAVRPAGWGRRWPAPASWPSSWSF